MAADWVDTVQKGKDIVSCLEQSSAQDRVEVLIELYPDMLTYQRRIIGDLLGLQRETVSRAVSAYKKNRRKV